MSHPPIEKKCDVVYALKNYVKPLMQLMTNDILSYNMSLITTKCLNTSVLLLVLLLGKDAIKIADQCNSNLTKQIHKERLKQPEQQSYNVIYLRKLETELLSKITSTRYIFYILMTDSYFIDTNGNATGFFPGHVILIEKFPGKNNNDKPYYYLYQSYIYQYTLHGHFEKSPNKSIKYTYKQMQDFIGNLNYIMKNDTWDDKSIEFWQQFTHVNTEKLKGTHSKNQFFLCYRKAKMTQCANNVKTYVSSKLEELNTSSKSLDDIYGDSSRYDMSEGPLTNGQMKESLQNLMKSLSFW